MSIKPSPTSPLHLITIPNHTYANAQSHPQPTLSHPQLSSCLYRPFIVHRARAVTTGRSALAHVVEPRSGLPGQSTRIHRRVGAARRLGAGHRVAGVAGKGWRCGTAIMPCLCAQTLAVTIAIEAVRACRSADQRRDQPDPRVPRTSDARTPQARNHHRAQNRLGIPLAEVHR